MFVYCVLSVAILFQTPVQSTSLTFKSESMKSKISRGTDIINKDSNVYLFASDGKKKPYSFVNEFGELVGFDVDIVQEVCLIAGKRCHTILAEFTECIFTDRNIDYAGRGLMSAWFDGCPGYQITDDRKNEFDFTLPYLTSSASFTVAPGNPSRFSPDLSDYSNYTILHLTGAPTNTECLRRLNKKFKKIMIAQNLPEAKLLLFNASADVLFSPRNEIDGLLVLPQRVHCDNVGAGIMLKKGSNIHTWWNPAFKTFYFSGEYTQMCKHASSKYGGMVQCLSSLILSSPQISTSFSVPVQNEEKLWTFVVSGRIKPYSYLNDDGKLVGFTKDMLDVVCKMAGRKCTLLLAQVSECSFRKGELLYPGRGLMEGWFDACTGYFDTLDRENSWDFTSSYLMSNASFYVVKGNPSGFDPEFSDYSNFTIVYQATAITNNHCLNRLNKKFKQLIVVENMDQAIDLVLNRTADTWFTKETGVTQLEQLGQRLHCEHVGTSIMTKKGSVLPKWWNLAFGLFYSTGEYNKFCLEEGKIHNYNFPCVEAPEKPL